MSFDSILNWAIPALLLAIAIGFVWTKFIQPLVLPMLSKLFAYIQGKGNEEQQHKYREIIYE